MTDSIQFHGLGAVNTLTIYRGGQPDTFDKSIALVSAYSRLLSFYDPDSLLSQINRQAGKAPVSIPVRPVFNLIANAVSWSKRNMGYNALLGPLVSLWHIGFADAKVPNGEEIRQRLALCDPNRVVLDSEQQSVYLNTPGMAMDLGGIAKGFILDELKKLWVKQRVVGGLIDLAGNQLLFGQSEKGIPLWQVPIQDPRSADNPPIAQLTTAPKAVVATGIYFRHFEQAGQSYHHLLDPKTGQPIASDMASVTVIADSAETADVLSSIGFYAGVPAGYDQVEAAGAQAVFITKSTQLYKTAGLRETLLPTM